MNTNIKFKLCQRKGIAAERWEGVGGKVVFI